jgi:hypothetical protein
MTRRSSCEKDESYDCQLNRVIQAQRVVVIKAIIQSPLRVVVVVLTLFESAAFHFGGSN